MKKVIALSVRPEWLVKILNGEKTIEVRTTFPRHIELPAEVYLYCTRSLPELNVVYCKENDCWKHYYQTSKNWTTNAKDILNFEILNGLIPCKFTMKKTEKLDYKYFENNSTTADAYAQGEIFVADFDEPLIEKQSCLNVTELWNYLGKKGGYAWHIDDLVIFDKPMKLDQFSKLIYLENQWKDEKTFIVNGYHCMPIMSAPQSWQYAYMESGK